MKSGIYIITTPTINEKCYIGSAINIARRWGQHKSELIKNKHHNPLLQHVANKYSIEVFVFKVLFLCSKETLLINEQKTFKVYNPEYNILKVAGSSFGRKCKEETKAKISAKLKGRVIGLRGPVSEETKAKMSASQKGKPRKPHVGSGRPKGYILTEETKNKIANSHLGLRHSEETKNKMRVAKHKNNN